MEELSLPAQDVEDTAVVESMPGGTEWATDEGGWVPPGAGQDIEYEAEYGEIPNFQEELDSLLRKRRDVSYFEPIRESFSIRVNPPEYGDAPVYSQPVPEPRLGPLADDYDGAPRRQNADADELPGRPNAQDDDIHFPNYSQIPVAIRSAMCVSMHDRVCVCVQNCVCACAD